VTASICDRFLDDHRRVETGLERLLAVVAANYREDMSRLWTDFDAGLLAHLEAEEKYLIPALSRVCERDARVVVQEHRHIRTRLTELGTAVDLHLVQLSSVRNFIDELRAHAKSEDRLLYQWADGHLDEPGHTSVIDALARKPTA
jgi:hemerythrin superfamily protein